MTISLTRPLFLTILRAALASNEYDFARQSALEWLSAFPGDLQVSQSYARALIGENSVEEARIVLKGLCHSDPEDLEAVQGWLTLERKAYEHNQLRQGLSVDHPENGKAGATSSSQENIVSILSNWEVALRDDSPPTQKTQPGWGGSLQLFRKSVETGDFTTAEQYLPDLIIQETNSPLFAVTHLKLLQADPNAPLPARRRTAPRPTGPHA